MWHGPGNIASLVWRPRNPLSDGRRPSAFLASVSGSHCLTQQILPCRLRDSAGIAEPTFLAAVEDWKARAGCSVTPQDATKQKAWDMPLVNVAAQRLLSTAPNQVGLARLLRSQHPRPAHSYMLYRAHLSAPDLMTRRCASRLPYDSAPRCVPRIPASAAKPSTHSALMVYAAVSRPVVTADIAP
jgi:hypothetical protein